MRLWFCKACGWLQRGLRCDEMECENCHNCDWSPRADKSDEEVEQYNAGVPKWEPFEIEEGEE